VLSKTDAVILCGGLGKRLQPVVSTTSKVMAEVSGRPFLDIVIAHLKKQGIRRVILCTGHKAEQVEDYYRKDPQGLTFEFSREFDPLGTGGALKNAWYFIESDPFLVLNGDSFCAVDLNAFVDFHHSKLARASVVISSATDASAFGKIFLDEEVKIVKFREKDPDRGGHGVNAGVYCFNEDVSLFMPDAKRFSLEHDVLPALVGKGFYGFCVDQEFYDIGTPERYEAARQVLERTKE